MPKSRSRKPRPSARRQGRASRREPGRECWELDPTRVAEQLEELTTPDDLRSFDRCLDAEAQGDARSALGHRLCSPYVVGSMHVEDLRELVGWGQDAPGWVYSRWVRAQSYRWLLANADPRTDDVVKTTWMAAYLDLDPERPMGLSQREFGTRLAVGDWICEQLAVYEYGGLLDFIEVRASAELLERCDGVTEWLASAMRGFTLDDVVENRLQVTDLASGDRLEVLNLGAMTDRDRGAAVLGRLVPITDEPGLMFDVRPLEVDLETAREASRRVLAGNDMGWIDAVALGRHAGRLPLGFSMGNATPLSTDIVPEVIAHPHDASTPAEEAGRIRDLLDHGLSASVANGVAVCEAALVAVEVSGAQGASLVGPHVLAVLAEPDVYAAAREHSRHLRHVEHWRLLATATPEPIRTRCLELAIRCQSGD